MRIVGWSRLNATRPPTRGPDIRLSSSLRTPPTVISLYFSDDSDGRDLRIELEPHEAEYLRDHLNTNLKKLGK